MWLTPPNKNEPGRSQRRPVSVRGESMQELAIAQPIRQADRAVSFEQEDAALVGDFEARLADSSTLAFRVARSVLRNSADAEEVAQEASLQAYRNFRGLPHRQNLRACLLPIPLPLPLL